MPLVNCLATYSHVQLHQQSAECITDNWGTHGCLTQLINQPQQKYTEQFLALIHTWIIIVLIWLLNGDKRYVGLEWCASKTPFGKSGHIHMYYIRSMWSFTQWCSFTKKKWILNNTVLGNDINCSNKYFIGAYCQFTVTMLILIKVVCSH